MICESDLLPPEDGALRVLWEPERVLAVTDDGRAVSCSPTHAPRILARLRGDGGRTLIWSAPGHDPGPAIAELGATGDGVEHRVLDQPVVSWFAGALRGGIATVVRQPLVVVVNERDWK